MPTITLIPNIKIPKIEQKQGLTLKNKHVDPINVVSKLECKL
jgi:hypothetical protein